MLLESRPDAKKAVIVVTDGRSNIGPPPVRIVRELLALSWEDSDGHDAAWNAEKYGPQVEIYAFSVGDANTIELKSIASRLPAHVFRLSTFSLFAEFARSLHGGLPSSFRKTPLYFMDVFSSLFCIKTIILPCINDYSFVFLWKIRLELFHIRKVAKILSNFRQFRHNFTAFYKAKDHRHIYFPNKK